MSSLIVVKPITVTPAMLVATDVPEADHPEYSAATTYAAGARVIVTADHKVYESVQAGNIGHTPASSPLWWSEVSATNRWKAFDLSNSSQTAKSTSLYYEITPGSAVNSVAALNLTGAQSIRIRLTDPAFGLLYDKTTQLTSIPLFSTWYDWFFSSRVEQPQHVALDLPSFPNATVRIDITGAAALAVGVILLGQQQEIGIGVRVGVRVGIQDFSRKEKNTWGDTVLVQRAFAKTVSFPVVLDNEDLDRVQSLLAGLRASPSLWVGSGKYAAMTAFGFYSNFEILVSYSSNSDCNIDIEGLT